ncbi:MULTISPECIES: hypothetical protein [Pseudomonas]|uniref:hypothetical protein n=1 Tax=Pseudomonas TaxID=286 RepID=UPI000AB34FAF|nr:MULTISPECIES: hypothetical protein [Pseudomonas]MCK8654835.1 hypothetical protein [Pseudomonas umsongensis]
MPDSILAAAEMAFAGKPAPTGCFAGNKKPDNFIGRGLARQAGNSLWADLTLGIRQKRSLFSPGSASVAG